MFQNIGKIKELVGSITNPQRNNLALVVLPASINEKYESSVQSKIYKCWNGVRTSYRSRFVNRDDFKLGSVITQVVNSDIWVSQILCLNEKNKIDKNGFAQSLKKLIKEAKDNGAYVHISNRSFAEVPGLKKIFLKTMQENGLNVFIYDELGEINNNA